MREIRISTGVKGTKWRHSDSTLTQNKKDIEPIMGRRHNWRVAYALARAVTRVSGTDYEPAGRNRRTKHAPGSLCHKEKRTSLRGEVLYGAPGRARTADLRVTNALLCQLSHGSVSAAGNSAGYIDPKTGRALKLRVNEGHDCPHTS